MKTMILGIAATIAIGVGAWFVLDGMGFSTAERTMGDNVRLD